MIRCFWTISTLIGAILMMASQAWAQEVPFKHKFRWCGADDPGMLLGNGSDLRPVRELRHALDLDVRSDGKNAVAQFLLKPVHDRQHDDQRRHAERDARHRHQRDERYERVAPGALAGARVAKADGQFVWGQGEGSWRLKPGRRGDPMDGAFGVAKAAAARAMNCNYRMLD